MDGGKKTVTRTVRQYNSVPIAEDDFKKLQEIAGKYQKVKNVIYERYGSIRGLERLIELNVVQKELLQAGIREELKIPSIYYQMAAKEAVSDIRARWETTKKKVAGAVRQNEVLNETDRHYIHFLLKVDQAFVAVTNKKPVRLQNSLQEAFEALASEVETRHLDNYLRRQVRKYHSRPHSTTADILSVDRRGYSYRDHGIDLASGRKRFRIHIPMRDSREFDRQLVIRLLPRTRGIEIYAPIEVRVRPVGTDGKAIGLSLGMYTMFVTDEGHEYGADFGSFQTVYSDWLREEAIRYDRNKMANPGRKKHEAKKRRLEEKLHSYIGRELNRMLEEEKPALVCLARFPRLQPSGYGRNNNYRLSTWHFRYVTDRLEMKCEERGVLFKKVSGSGMGNICSSCGAENERKRPGMFICSACGYTEKSRVNTARNALAKGVGNS